jgi:hypothetical protein
MYRLVTTLTDHHRYPAGALIALYHEHGEHESAYFALRHTIMDGRVLRAGDRSASNRKCGRFTAIFMKARKLLLSRVGLRSQCACHAYSMSSGLKMRAAG